MNPGHWSVLGAGVVFATYSAIAVLYLRLGIHALRWTEAALRAAPNPDRRGGGETLRALAGAALDVLLLRRLFAVNPALWVGEWLFHASLLLVLLRHLRYFTEPVPTWVAWAQTPGWIAGFLLPVALPYVLALRLLSRREPFSSRANLLVLLDLLGLAVTGLLLATRHRVDLVQVKAYALGIVTLRPTPPPADPLLIAHLGLVLALASYLPSHVFTAPLTLFDARRRDSDLKAILHDA
jgi:nitrate reductase gamma subunit